MTGRQSHARTDARKEGLQKPQTLDLIGTSPTSGPAYQHRDDQPQEEQQDREAHGPLGALRKSLGQSIGHLRTQSSQPASGTLGTQADDGVSG